MAVLFHRAKAGAGAPGSVGGSGPSTIEDVIGFRQVTAEFQPIVRLDTNEHIAFEAFARGPVGPLATPAAMFAAAAAVGLVGELDQVAHAAAYQAALTAQLHPSLSLFVNADPGTLGGIVPADLVPVVVQALARLRLLVEISEINLITNPAAALAGVERVRATGWGVAWDNAGATPDSLALMSFIRPDVVKIDVPLLDRRARRDSGRVINAALAYAQGSGAAILATGIETRDHVRLARGLGATLGQGYFYGRPAGLPPVTAAPQGAIGFVTAPPVVDPGRTPYEICAEAQRANTANLATVQTMAHYLEQRCSMDPEPPVVLACLRDGSMPSGAPLAFLEMVGRSAAFVAAVLPELPDYPVAGIRLVRLAPADPMRDEWVLAVVGPHFSALLAARPHPSAVTDDAYDLVVSYDRGTVLHAARTLLSRVTAEESTID